MCIGVRPASTTLVSAADSESQSCKSSLSAALRSVCAALRPMNELSVCCCALFSVVYPRRPRVVAKPKCSHLKLESIRYTLSATRLYAGTQALLRGMKKIAWFSTASYRDNNATGSATILRLFQYHRPANVRFEFLTLCLFHKCCAKTSKSGSFWIVKIRRKLMFFRWCLTFEAGNYITKFYLNQPLYKIWQSSSRPILDRDMTAQNEPLVKCTVSRDAWL